MFEKSLETSYLQIQKLHYLKLLIPTSCAFEIKHTVKI